jgi:hypothetical protein
MAGHEHRVLSQVELVAEATARFGADAMQWAFECPSCGDVASGQDFRDALAAHPRTRNGEPVRAFEIFGQECIGRTLGALARAAVNGRAAGVRGCDWAAYGLISGPWTVLTPDGRRMSSFPLAAAGRPPPAGS